PRLPDQTNFLEPNDEDQAKIEIAFTREQHLNQVEEWCNWLAARLHAWLDILLDLVGQHQQPVEPSLAHDRCCLLKVANVISRLQLQDVPAFASKFFELLEADLEPFSILLNAAISRIFI